MRISMKTSLAVAEAARKPKFLDQVRRSLRLRVGKFASQPNFPLEVRRALRYDACFTTSSRRFAGAPGVPPFS